MRLGILGGGQLARMMAIEAHWLGIQTSVFDPKPDCCAGLVADHHCADYDDRERLSKFAADCSAVTCDFENVPSAAISHIERTLTPFHPKGISYFQNRYYEKGFLKQNGLPVVEFEPAYSLESLTRAAEHIKTPLVVKKQMMGYDGKGQAVVREMEALKRAWSRLAKAEGPEPVIVEEFINFEREISVVAVRGRDGRFVNYPITTNIHSNGILKCSLVTSQPVGLTIKAAGHAHKLMKKLDYLGVMAVEFFQRGEELIINEVAPRPHNTGHWSIDGATCSQFENHVRAVLGLPLGAAVSHYPCCAMINLIGADVGEVERHEKMIFHLGVMIPNFAKVHNYCKSHAPGRKLGHIFLYASRVKQLLRRIKDLQELIQGASDLYDLEFEIPKIVESLD